MIQPPGRIEQLNNFQDSLQSPDGLDRLRAFQQLEQALPSSQGLMGMPQVQAPAPQMQPQVPVMARQYGGEVGTGGLVGLTADGTQIFDNSQEGALNRATHGGILEGYNYTPSTGGTSTATGTLTTGHPGEQGYKLYDGIIQKDDPMDAPGTLAADSSYGARLPKDAIEGTALYNLDPVQQRGGIYNAHDVRDSGMSLIRPADAPVTLIQEQTQTPYRDPYTGKIPYDLWHEPVVNDFGQGYDLKDMDYFTANALALKEGATRFKYNNEYARVDPGLLSNYDYSNLGTKPYSYVDNLAINQPDVAFNKIHSGMAADPNSQAAKSAQGLYPQYYGGWSDTPGAGNTPYPSQPNLGPSRMQGTYGNWTRAEGGQIMNREGGGQIDPSQAAEGLASFGRYGDNILVHMNPEELDGLASLGNITYNPVTGLPEAFSFGKLFKGLRKLAPVVAMVAAPYLLGPQGLGLFTKSFLGSTLGAATAGGIGGFFGNLIAGAKPKDALKSGLTSAVLSGAGAAISGAPWTGGGAGTGTNQIAAMSPGSTNLKAGLGVGTSGYGVTPGAGGSQFSGAANIGKTIGPASSSALAPMRQQAFKLQSNAYGVTPQIQAGQAMTAPQLQNIITEGQAGANKLYEGAQASNLQFNQAQAQPTNMIERIQQSPLVQNTGEAFTNIGKDIVKDYGNWKGAAKIL